jgi:hypothetical protein
MIRRRFATKLETSIAWLQCLFVSSTRTKQREAIGVATGRPFLRAGSKQGNRAWSK